MNSYHMASNMVHMPYGQILWYLLDVIRRCSTASEQGSFSWYGKEQYECAVKHLRLYSREGWKSLKQHECEWQ